MAREAPSTYKPVNDAYTGMLTISLIALITGCVLLFLDYSQYPEREPPKVKAFAPAPKIDQNPTPPATDVDKDKDKDKDKEPPKDDAKDKDKDKEPPKDDAKDKDKDKDKDKEPEKKDTRRQVAPDGIELAALPCVETLDPRTALARTRPQVLFVRRETSTSL